MDNQDKKARVAKLVSELISCIGDDPERPGLQKTPMRVAHNLQEIFSGYQRDPIHVLSQASNVAEGQIILSPIMMEPITISGINFISYCEHDFLPMVGEITIAYIPKQKVVGFSKFYDVVDILTKRLQIQERLTQEIAEIIDICLEPRGVAVSVKAYNYCILPRSSLPHLPPAVYTEFYLGNFKTDHILKSNFQQKIL